MKETTDIIYTIIDIETTGGKFNEEKITEIAIFKLSKFGNISKYHKLVNPEKKISKLNYLFASNSFSVLDICDFIKIV